MVDKIFWDKKNEQNWKSKSWYNPVENKIYWDCNWAAYVPLKAKTGSNDSFNYYKEGSSDEKDLLLQVWPLFSGTAIDVYNNFSVKASSIEDLIFNFFVKSNNKNIFEINAFSAKPGGESSDNKEGLIRNLEIYLYNGNNGKKLPESNLKIAAQNLINARIKRWVVDGKNNLKDSISIKMDKYKFSNTSDGHTTYDYHESGMDNCDIDYSSSSGDNIIDTVLMRRSKIKFGDGSNIIKAMCVDAGKISMGNGKNEVTIGDSDKDKHYGCGYIENNGLRGADLTFGNGGNKLTILCNEDIPGGPDGAVSGQYDNVQHSITFGSGADVFTTKNLTGYRVSMGGGNDSLINNGLQIGASVSMGKGNDSCVLSIIEYSWVENANKQDNFIDGGEGEDQIEIKLQHISADKPKPVVIKNFENITITKNAKITKDCAIELLSSSKKDYLTVNVKYGTKDETTKTINHSDAIFKIALHQLSKDEKRRDGVTEAYEDKLNEIVTKIKNPPFDANSKINLDLKALEKTFYDQYQVHIFDL